MNEEQAKKTACCGPPAVAAAAYHAAGWPVDAPMKCLGSACMAWRVSIPADPGNSAYPKGDFYCGLAGVPQ